MSRASIWAIIGSIAAPIVVLVALEETYLAERYGSVYANYRLRVRRWP